MGEARCATRDSCSYYLFVEKRMVATTLVLFIVLCLHLFITHLSEKELLPRRYSMGRRIRFGHGIHGHVVDGAKESRELVLVDCYKLFIYSTLFCERAGVYKRILCDLVG